MAEAGAYYCPRCRKSYPVKDEIVFFLDNEAISKQEGNQVKYFDRHPVITEHKYILEEWHRSFLRRFEDSFPKVAGKTVVDLGPGQGYMTIELAKAGALVIAVDLSLNSLRRLQRVVQDYNLQSRVMLICGSAQMIPLKNKTADLVIANAILEHLEKEKTAIEEISRINKDRAGLMVTVPLAWRFLNPLLIPIFLYKDWRIGHLRRYDEITLREKFSPFGFQKQQIWYSGHSKKVMLTFLSYLLSSHKFDKFMEQLDWRDKNSKLWASNICLTFNRVK